MNVDFVEGFEKVAKEGKNEHHVRRFFLGNPISSAIEAKSGKKTKAFGEAWGHGAVESLKGVAKGALGGAGVGVAASLLSRGKIKARRAIGGGAAVGGYGGGIYGGLKGQHGSEASKIHGKYSDQKK